MRHTDYAAIAAHYDEANERHDILAEPLVAEQLAAIEGPIEVLDVACGTGNWLQVQRRAHPDQRIGWHGIDASEAMLGRARAKLGGAGAVGAPVGLRLGQAEALPYDDGRFALVACRFAFHHFIDKDRALDELVRVCAAGGAISMTNVAPERMAGWWVYRFFPEARLHDERRYWSVELLTHDLERRGLAVQAEVHTRLGTMAAEQIHARAAKRDVSSLAIVDDAHFRAGMAQLAALSAERGRVQNVVAVARWQAHRRVAGA